MGSVGAYIERPRMQYSLQCATFLQLVPAEKLIRKNVFRSRKSKLTTSRWRVRWLCVGT